MNEELARETGAKVLLELYPVVFNPIRFRTSQGFRARMLSLM